MKEKTRDVLFWERWLAAGQLDREQQIAKLPLLRDADALRGQKDRGRIFAGFVNSYFEDLESVLTAKLLAGRRKR